MGEVNGTGTLEVRAALKSYLVHSSLQSHTGPTDHPTPETDREDKRGYKRETKEHCQFMRKIQKKNE